VFTLGLLSISIVYGLEAKLANRDEIIALELEICNQNSLRTWVRQSEYVRVSKLEVQPINSVYELDKHLALSNEIRDYRTDI